MEGMTDWNKLTMEQYIEHLENKFRFDSSGTAKAVFELIAAYRALTIHNVSQQRELLKSFADWLQGEVWNDKHDDFSDYVEDYIKTL